jgi:propanediol dehydratase small subunit
LSEFANLALFESVGACFDAAQHPTLSGMNLNLYLTTRSVTMSQTHTTSFTGRSLQDLTIEKVLDGELTAEDFRTNAETLREQAKKAAAGGYRQLAENLQRAAELTCLSNEEVLDTYNQLRPGRSNYKSLIALAERLEKEHQAPLTSALVREAAEVYLQRGIFQKGE